MALFAQCEEIKPATSGGVYIRRSPSPPPWGPGLRGSNHTVILNRFPAGAGDGTKELLPVRESEASVKDRGRRQAQWFPVMTGTDETVGPFRMILRYPTRTLLFIRDGENHEEMMSLNLAEKQAVVAEVAKVALQCALRDVAASTVDDGCSAHEPACESAEAGVYLRCQEHPGTACLAGDKFSACSLTGDR